MESLHDFGTPRFATSTACLGVVTMQTLWLFHGHLNKWKLPFLQKLYLRIVLLPFVFSVCAYIALFFPEQYLLLDATRHVYEGYVLYCFASLMILYSGGDQAVEAAFNAVREDPAPRIVYGNPFRFPCCELVHFDSSQTVLNLHKAGVMQYMLVGPLLEVGSYIATNNGVEISHSVAIGLSAVRGCSILTTMRSMLGIYWLLKAGLHELGAVTKFTVIKVVVFLAVVQGIILSHLLSAGVLAVPPYITEEYVDEGLSSSQITEQFLSRVLLLEMTIVGAFGFMVAFRARDIPDMVLVEDDRAVPEIAPCDMVCPRVGVHGKPSDSLGQQLLLVAALGDVLVHRLDTPNMFAPGDPGEKAALVAPPATESEVATPRWDVISDKDPRVCTQLKRMC